MKTLIDNNNELHTIKSYHKGWELSLKNFEKMQSNKKYPLTPVCDTLTPVCGTQNGTNVCRSVGHRPGKITYKKRIAFIFWLCCIMCTGFARLGNAQHRDAQTLTQTIRGKVIDQESLTPVIGANIVILGTDPVLGASTDVNGEFKIQNVPVGRHTLQTSSIGYEEAVIPELVVGSGKEVVLTVRLTESLVKMDELVITANQEKNRPNNDLATVSARSFTVEETKRYAAAVNDPGRMALSFAGVATGDDESNIIVIRGNSPKGLLWRIEGVEVPNPNHFGEEGSSGGGISMLSVNMLDNSDFFTGAFPAEYGNAASGVFDIKLRNGNNQQREYAFQAGFLGIDFAAEGPFSKNSNASYLVNYRYSTLGILEGLGLIPQDDAIPNFQDLSFKVNVPTKKAGVFSVWGLGGLSSQDLKEEGEEESFRYNMGVGGLSHVYFFGDKTFLESNLTFSKSLNKFTDDEPENAYFFEDNFENTAVRGSFLLNHKFNARHTLRSGFIASHLGFDALDETNLRDTTYTEVDSDGSTQLLQGYAQWKYRINEQFTLNTGFHYLYFALNDSDSFEPRLGLQWAFTPRQSLSFGFGIHSRIDPIANYFAQYQTGVDEYVQPNKNLQLSKARHYVIGYDNMLREDLHMKIEAYYQDLYDVPIGLQQGIENPWYATYSMLNYENGIVDVPLANNGTGRNYGLELTLEKFFTYNYYFMLTTSLFESKYTPLDGKEYNTRFNGNYIVNLLAGKEFQVGKRKTNVLGINARLLLSGGNRTTPIDLESSNEEGRPVYEWDQRYSERLGSYFRTDLRISYRINKPKFSSIISLDIQNVTNHQNVFSQYYDRSTGKIEKTYQLGLIPVLNYRIEF